MAGAAIAGVVGRILYEPSSIIETVVIDEKWVA